MNKSNANIGKAGIIGVLTLCFYHLINSYIYSPLTSFPRIMISITSTQIIWAGLWIIMYFGSMFLALTLSNKIIVKAESWTPAGLLISLVFGVATWLVIRILGRLGLVALAMVYVRGIILFALGTVGGIVFLSNVKTDAPVETFQAASVNYGAAPAPAYTPVQQAPVGYTQQYAAPENMDGLSAAILNAIRPSLKAPLTAVLCTPEQMKITNNGGVYDVQGFVNSQNSYGAMIATDFTAKAQYVNGNWMILSSTIGVQNAKNYAKSFASNYIVISIFTGVMGLLGYFILKMIFGF